MPEDPNPETPEPAPAQEPAATPAEVDWKAEAQKWEKRSKENFAKLEEAKPKLSEYDRLVEASKTDLERKTEEVNRWQTEAQQWRGTAVSSRIEALAAADFADPSDAASNLDPSKYLGAGGEIDQEAIKADLADLLARKPHYKRSTNQTAPSVPVPNRAQGAGGKATADPAAEFAALLQGQLGR